MVKSVKPPLIIIGMHRSGTTMLTGFMSQLGIFTGKDKTENDESKFFQNINRWILYQMGAAWDSPGNSDLMSQEFIARSARIIGKRLNSPWSMQYLGLRRYLARRGIMNLTENWGWKDPRTTLLLPIYKTLFEDAKVIHIYRNPIDVAQSLKRREEHKRGAMRIGVKDRIKAEILYYERIMSHSLVANDIERGVALWEFYAQKAWDAQSRFGNYLAIKYEDFLSDPKCILMDLVRFLELPDSPGLIDQVCSKVNSDRKYAFVTDPQLLAYYKTIKGRPLIQQLGYGSI